MLSGFPLSTLVISIVNEPEKTLETIEILFIKAVLVLPRPLQGEPDAPSHTNTQHIYNYKQKQLHGSGLLIGMCSNNFGCFCWLVV